MEDRGAIARGGLSSPGEENLAVLQVILGDRPERLLENGIVEQTPVGEGVKPLAYQLTSKGKALLPEG